MPIFEFRCNECGVVFEKLFFHSEEKVDMACPGCQSPSFERVMSRARSVPGGGPGGKKPRVTSRSCSPSNQCVSLDLPGPAK